MNLETELKEKLVCLAECRIDPETWSDWWKVHAGEVKKMVSCSDFRYLDRVPGRYGSYSYMVKCQQGAERYLTKAEIPFCHSDIYSRRADEECRLYNEELEQKRIAEQEEEQKRQEMKRREIEKLSSCHILVGGKSTGIRTLPLGAENAEIIKLLIEWTELLAKEKYREAFEMFQHYNHELDWTPELLESAVYGYGCPGYTREEAEREFGSSDYKITSLLENPEKDEILMQIDIEYGILSEKDAEMRCLTGTDYENIIGDIHYSDVPLNGERSDLTAIFYIKRVDTENITLSFYDLHVM